MSVWKKIGFIAGYSLPLVILFGYYLPVKPFTAAGPIYVYLAVPLIDFLLGRDRNNVIRNEFESLTEDRYFDFLVYSHVYIQYAMLGWMCYILLRHELSTLDTVRLVVAQGLYSGTIINVAHELGHRKSKWAIIHARIALISVFYHHFIVEHNRGHHVHVATPHDPATARKGQTLYAFWLQTIVGSFKSAWSIEKEMLLKKNMTVWGFENKVLLGVLASLFIFLLAFGIGSLLIQKPAFEILILMFCQAFVAILLLEAVNYIEHYGILRREVSFGKFEKVNPLHSWNANHFYSNLLLFNLQRHSDHHAFAARPYQVLRHFDESPQLPFGYPLMIIMALFPPVWFRFMNDRLKKWEAKAFDSEHINYMVRKFA